MSRDCCRQCDSPYHLTCTPPAGKITSRRPTTMPKRHKLAAVTPQLRAIVLTIDADFGHKPAAYAARPYIDALLSLPVGATAYYEDDVDTLARYLRGNLKGWRGGIAAETKGAFDVLLAGEQA